MVRKELREHIFKMLFQIEFNDPQEMPEQIEYYFSTLEDAADKDKEYIYMNPNSVAHHFGLGLMIRNKYIYNNDNEYVSDSPDNLSSIIVSKIASMIIENYDYKNPMCRWLYDSFEFPYYRKLYFVVNH